MLTHNRVAGLFVATALVAFQVADASAAARKPGCQAAKIRVAGGCVSRAAAANHIVAITRETMRHLRIKAAIVQLDTGLRPLLSRAFGSSMVGVPARRDMRFRIGSMAIPYLIRLLQLEDQGRLSLDDKLSRFLPRLPNAERTCFDYAHTNYAVLSEVIARVSGRPVASLMRQRIFKPLGLRHTDISREPALRGPVLHAYTAQRGPYEDSTYWSPSWTLGAGSVMSSTIDDVARTARYVGTGALISRRASRERFAPTTVGMGGFTKDNYFGLGIIVANGWYAQNPNLNGYTGAMAYLPARKLSIAIVASHRLGASDALAYAP